VFDKRSSESRLLCPMLGILLVPLVVLSSLPPPVPASIHRSTPPSHSSYQPAQLIDLVPGISSPLPDSDNGTSPAGTPSDNLTTVINSDNLTPLTPTDNATISISSDNLSDFGGFGAYDDILGFLKTTVLVGPDDDIEIKAQNGKVALHIPKGTISSSTRIELEEYIPPASTGMQIVTLFELNANLEKSNEIITNFNKTLGDHYKSQQGRLEWD